MRLMRDLVGETLSDRYRIVGRVAGGGMGEVYRAHDLLLDRPVAVKILQHSLANDPELVARFRAEARAAARLSHPNVVGVHDWGSEDDQTYYMVMEYVSGSDVRDVLVGRGALEPAQAVEIMAAVCDALGAAHVGGLVHRDIKPENILIARDGTVKVADFGIAVVSDADRTMPGGGITGTLRYLSPEQARGEEATPASDIWAAGAVLGELLTGLPPQQGAGPDMLKMRAEFVPEPPSEQNPVVPKDLDEIVMRACAQDPNDRYRDAAQMAQDLRRIAVRSVKDAPPIAELLDQLTGEIRLPDLEPTSMLRTRRRAPKKKRTKGRAIAILVVLALLALAVRAGASLVLPKMVEVPDLVGMSKGDAKAAATQIGLEVIVIDKERDPEAPEGEVLSQSPQDGELEEDSAIELVVSAGPPLVRVPNLTGELLDKAQANLEAKNLQVSVSKQFSLEAEGTVIQQQPIGGKLEWGESVGLIVSKGPEPTEIPSVEGMKYEKAAAKLESAGFAVTPVDAYSDKVEEGFVISTSPEAGEVIGQGSEIKVYVSVGPQYREFAMPDVRGMNVDAARSLLESKGLRVDVQESCPGGTSVAESQPTAGQKVRENQVVALFVC